MIDWCNNTKEFLSILGRDERSYGNGVVGGLTWWGDLELIVPMAIDYECEFFFSLGYNVV